MLQQTKVGDMIVVDVAVTRLDAGVAEEFRTALTRLVEEGERHFTLRMDAVEHIDSAGLNAVMGLNKQVGRAGSVELTGVKGAVLKVMKLTRVSQILTINEQAA